MQARNRTVRVDDLDELALGEYRQRRGVSGRPGAMQRNGATRVPWHASGVQRTFLMFTAAPLYAGTVCSAGAAAAQRTPLECMRAAVRVRSRSGAQLLLRAAVP